MCSPLPSLFYVRVRYLNVVGGEGRGGEGRGGPVSVNRSGGAIHSIVQMDNTVDSRPYNRRFKARTVVWEQRVL